MTTGGKFIFKATLVIAFFKLISLALGVMRDATIGQQFGTTGISDAYFMAIKLPNMVHGIIGGILVTVVVPVFAEYLSRGQREEGWKVFKTVMTLVVLTSIIISCIGVLGAPLLAKLVAPGFTGEKEKLLVELARIILPLLIFQGMATLFTCLLNVNNIFGLPAFSNSVNNIVIIVSTLTLGNLCGIHGLALGTVLAMACMALVQFPALFKTGFHFDFHLDLKHPGVKKVYLLALPVVLGLSVNQVNVLIIGRLASWLPEGNISALAYADKLIQSPIGLFVLALGTAIFPLLSTRAAQGDKEAFSGALLGALRVVILSMVPASLGLMVMSQPIVSLIFQRGIFKEGSVELTAAALMFYAVGLLGQAAVLLLARGFYSLQDTRTPVKIGIVTVIINIGLSLVLIHFLQHRGLALANSLANLANMVLLMWFLEKKLPGLYGIRFLKFILSVMAASGLMVVATYTASGFLAGQIPETAGLVVQVGLAVLVGIIVYLTAIFAFRVDEALFIWRYAWESLRRR